MPRKPKREKQTITVIVNNTPVAVILHPPTSTRPCWYAYWSGLATSKSTGQRKLEDATIAAENMVRTGGKRADLRDTVLSYDELVTIQKVHFERKTDEKAKLRAKRSFESCMEAITAFREITGLDPITLATPDDCAKFQRLALTMPNQWRRLPFEQRRPAEDYTPEARKQRQQQGMVDDLDACPCYSPNNVLKWCRSLQAAFERANGHALKRKCVRGVVDVKRLLTSNPWGQFTWIEGRGRPLRQFDYDELLSLLAFFESKAGMSVGAAAAKVFLWSCCRKLEVTGLTWDALRIVEKEVHFEIVGKWGVEKWFRIPDALYQDLLAFRTDSPFVFAAYFEQIRRFHDDLHPGTAKAIRDVFTPKNFARWFYERVKEWAQSQPNGQAYVHVFRKTALQLAWDGEDDVAQRVADDAGVSQSVLLGHYVKPKLWRKSNRTFFRIQASLPPEVASRYGHTETPLSALERKLESARADKDWPLVAELANRLAHERQNEAG